MKRREFLSLAAALSLGAALPNAAQAQQDFPNRPVRVIVPFTPGGANDIVARLVSNRLSEMWGKQVVVENKGGAGGNLGSEIVARADPDGYTIMLNSSGIVLNGFLYPNMTFDPMKDFAPLSAVCEQANVMIVPLSSPARTVPEFIAHAKANPGKLTFASVGLGTSLHLSAELLKAKAGLDMIHVPYRGTAPALADLLPGRIDLMFFSTGSVLPVVKQGTVRALGVTSLKRLEAAPDLPTVSESGLPGYEAGSWFAFFAPAKTPPEIVQKLSADIAASARHPSVKAKFEELGAVTMGTTSDELRALMQKEVNLWGPLIQSLGIKAAP